MCHPFIIFSNIFSTSSHVWKRKKKCYVSIPSYFLVDICAYVIHNPHLKSRSCLLGQLGPGHYIQTGTCTVHPEAWKAALIMQGSSAADKDPAEAFGHSCIFLGTDVCQPRYVPWQSVPKGDGNRRASYQAKPHLQTVLWENFITQEEFNSASMMLVCFCFVFFTCEQH